MKPQPRTSTCVKNVDVNPLTGFAVVEFLSGDKYEYKNVSKRACINLLTQPNMSLGFWVNSNCKAQGVKVKQITTGVYDRTVSKFAEYKKRYAHV